MEGTKIDHHPIRIELVENESSESQKSNTPVLKKDSSFSSADDTNRNIHSGNESSPRTTSSYKQKRFRNAWGNLSYANLIAAAILSSPKRKMKLNEIYAWFVANVPYFAQRDDETKSRGWKNSIRHNLSLKREFVRESGDKKAGYWFIDKDSFLQRLHSENRQINDPIYNKDMEIFESFVHRAFASAEWNDRYLLNQQANDYRDKNVYFNGYNYQVVNYNEMNQDLPNFTQPSVESEHTQNIDTNMVLAQNDNGQTTQMANYSNLDSNQQSAEISKQNPFRTLNSPDQTSYNISQTGQNGSSIIPANTKFMASDGSKIDKYMIYTPNNVIDANRYGQYSQMIPQYQSVNGDNMDIQQLMFHSNLNQNQYYTFSNVGFPLHSQGLFRDQPMNGFYETDPTLQNVNFNNRQFANTIPLLVKPNVIPQNFPYQTGINNETNKPLVN